MLYTTTGQLIKEIPLTTAYQQRIDVSDLASGVYILSLESEKGRLGVERFSIVR